MAEEVAVHYYSSVNPAADPNNSWALKLDTLYSMAQQGRRIKLLDVSGVAFPEEYVVSLSVNNWPAPTLSTPMPDFPVIWPRGTTPELAWDHVGNIAWMATAAATIELGYAEVALGSGREELRKLAALVTALRCGASRSLGRSCINVWRPSHEMTTYHDGKLALLRISKLPINRLLASTLDRRETITFDYVQAAKFGAYFVAMGAMARIGGPSYAMAMGQSRYAVSRLAELLGSDWSFLAKEVYVRDALLSEVWKAFPENVGDIINTDLIGQEVVSRCLMTEDGLISASILREEEYRANCIRVPRKTVRIARTEARTPVALSFSPEPSEVGDTECEATPQMRYDDLVLTPAPPVAIALSPLASPMQIRDDVVWSPESRLLMDRTMRNEHAKSQEVSPRVAASNVFGVESGEPPMLTD